MAQYKKPDLLDGFKNASKEKEALRMARMKAKKPVGLGPEPGEKLETMKKKTSAIIMKRAVPRTSQRYGGGSLRAAE